MWPYGGPADGLIATRKMGVEGYGQ